MEQSKPKISVIMSVYNGSRYLREAIDSILCQTFSDFEFIIIDDGSTDDSAEIITNYSHQDQRVKFHKNEFNIGLTKSLNKGIKLAQGQYIARQDADDISLPERFQKQVEFLDKNQNIILVSGNYKYIDSQGTTHATLNPANDPELIAWYFLFYNRIGAHGLVMFRHQPIVEIGGYAEDYRYSQDYELFSRLFKLGDVAILPEVLQLYRRNHSESISVSSRPKQEELAIAVSKRNIEQLTHTEINQTEVKDLKAFWLRKFPDANRVNQLNSNLKRIYQAFLMQHLNKTHSESYLKSKLNQTIGKQFLIWIQSLDIRRKPYSKLKVSLAGLAWHPIGVIDLWHQEIYEILKRFKSRRLVKSN